MNRQEAQELLPWFVAGTLNESEALAVQAFIDSGEISASELEELSLFRDTINEQSTFEPDYNPALLNNVMAQLESIPQDAPEEPLVVSEAKPASAGGLAGLLERIGWSQTPPFAKFAMAAQFAAVLALALVVASPAGDGDAVDNGQFEVVSGATSQADLTIAFAQGSREADIRALLLDLGAQIVEGPNSLGMYGVSIPESVDVQVAQQSLAASALTTYVQPVAQ